LTVHYAELNTNERKSKEEILEFVSACPDHAKFWAYEGEGGSWIFATWQDKPTRT
jgi:hypothetical protein